ncbi:MAG: T9SS type A sorting domain-containing protein, partial [Flavobacteriales bacterium]|nr:T9SS type A sorting domain-containing protein [Flavobacteriales bacterium]
QDSIPNAGMESWVNNLAYEDPTESTTLDPLTSTSGDEQPVKDTATGNVHSGSYEVQWKMTDLKRTPISIYPNPTQDVLYFDNAPKSDCYISIYNISGNLVLQGELAEYKRQLLIGHLPPGSYILELQHL